MLSLNFSKNKTLNLFKKAIASYYWVRALVYASNEEYVDALELIEKIEKKFPIKGEVKLFKGYLYYALYDYEAAVEVLSSSCNEIDESEKHSADEKDYLKCYASVFGQKCIEKIEYKTAYSFQVNYDSFNLDKVSEAIKNNFPLRSHPKWGEEKMG